MTASHLKPLEVWGGLECTVVRVADAYRSQLEDTGHVGRIEDLDAVAALGIRTLRYPVLWETVAPDDPDTCDWRFSDERLGRLKALGIAPIVGLVHHGSGPRYTSLTDPRFPDLMARHAERVARRYPWVEMFTPVNEPLTTARFSGLYGHWYPHGRDMPTFLRALVTQCRAIVLAMRAARTVTPHAKLVQTEDLGKVFSTPALRGQAEHENGRRWLSLDLLCGRVDRFHPWRRIFAENGIGDEELDFFLEGDGAPDVVGVNHYLTSERYLDENVHRYPERFHGGNGCRAYADVEAVRMDLPPDDLGPKARLAETWERYRLPIAVTEAHHGCTREEQLRWLMEVWDAARELRASGQDIRAVTVWSLFGAMDWNSLVTARNGFYEPGAFDVRGPRPRRTAIGAAAQALATTAAFTHPVLDGNGWWRRHERYFHAPRLAAPARPSGRPILITGATGTLGRAFARICAHRGLDHVVLSRGAMDIADRASVERALEHHRPWAVVNTAGYVRVADAEREPEACFLANARGAETVAQAAARLGLPYVTFSSDLVFDGSLGRPYVESDPVSPTGAYGASKAEAERRVGAAHPQALVVRTSAFFGPWDRYNFVHHVLSSLAAGRPIAPDPDTAVSPTYVPDLVHAVLDLLVDREGGVWHLANEGLISWADLAERVAAEAGLRWRAGPHTPRGAQRITALSSERGRLLPTLDSAIARYVAECEATWRQPVLAAAE